MLRVLEINFDFANRMLGTATGCRDSVRCLWGRPVDKEACRFEEPCSLLKFRKELEKQAPAFMGLYVKTSKFDSIMHDYAMIELEGNASQKEEARETFRDMFRFRYVSLLGLFSIYSANGEKVPYISKELVKKTLGEFSRETAREMLASNTWIVSRLNPLFFDTERQQQYKYLNYVLLMVFLRGYEEDGPVTPLAPVEEPAFFEAIESFMKIRRE